jgi:predicted alpha/beta-fold hydrolase
MRVFSSRALYGWSSTPSGVPPFEPHPLARGAHAQTILGWYVGGDRLPLAAAAHQVMLPDGDQLLVLESVPRGWEAPMPAAILVHGLAGCARANYVVRVSQRLLQVGIRVVRVNLRGAGDGFGLARGIYHAGRSEDLREVIKWLHARIEGSPIALIGFSLGANIVLKAGIEASETPLEGLDCLLAANAPIDLIHCCNKMRRPENRAYNWNFVWWLRAMVDRLHRQFPELGDPHLEGVRLLHEFDDRYTAPRAGFASAEDYYTRCSVARGLERISLPGLLVHALDDPFIAAEPFLHLRNPSAFSVELLARGGHLGYLSRRPWMGSRRWLDSRIVAWLSARWAGRLPAGTA